MCEFTRETMNLFVKKFFLSDQVPQFFLITTQTNYFITQVQHGVFIIVIERQTGTCSLHSLVITRAPRARIIVPLPAPIIKGSTSEFLLNSVNFEKTQ